MKPIARVLANRPRGLLVLFAVSVGAMAMPRDSGQTDRTRVVVVDGRIPPFPGWDSAPIGPAAGLYDVRAGRGGHWVTYCTDRYTQYLAIGDGAPERIDSLLAVDKGETHLVVARGEEIEHVDVVAGTRETIGLPGTDAGYADLQYGHLVAGRERVLVFGRADGTARRTIEVAGPVLGVAIASRRWARVLVEEHPSRQPRIRGWDTCFYIGPRGVDGTGYGERVVARWLDLERGVLVPAATGIWPVGDSWLRRSPDGAVYLGDQELLPASCHAQIYWIRSWPWAFRHHCEDELSSPDHPDVRRGPSPLGWPRLQRFQRLNHHPRFELTERSRPPLTPSDLRGETVPRTALSIVDRSRGTERFLPGLPGFLDTSECAGPTWRERGRYVAVLGAVIDVEQARIVATYPAYDLVDVDERGRVLLCTGDEPGCIGPLRWTAPPR